MAPREDDQVDTAIAEADRLEQAQQADPSVGPDQQWPGPPTPGADEANRLDQAHDVLADTEEEYPPNPP